MNVAPDTKDWTWVLERQCPECGFDTRRVQRGDLPRIMRGGAVEWQTILHGPDDVSRRSQEGVWSPLEYGCHVRDMFRVFGARLQLMLAEDDPVFPSWDHDETAMAERYWEQDPEIVSAEIREAVGGVAARLDGLGDGDWQRAGTRTDGVRFTVETLGRYLAHDQRHHIWDVTGRRQENL